MKQREQDQQEAFDKAVDWLVPHLKGFVSDSGVNFPRSDPMEAFLRARLVVEKSMPSGEKLFSISEENAYILSCLAQKDAGAFDLAKKVAVSHVIHGLALPVYLRLFLAVLVLGRRKRPRERRRNENWFRDVYFLILIDIIVDKFGLNATRNEGSKLHYSACDVVLKAFEKCGVRMGFRAVKDVISGKNTRQLRAEFAQITSAKTRARVLETLLKTNGFLGDQAK